MTAISLYYTLNKGKFGRLLSIPLALIALNCKAEIILYSNCPRGEITSPTTRRSTDERQAQDDLAAWIGMVREVLARPLKEFENKGAIDVHRGRIKIRNKKKLLD
jgi:hypothetical protein